MTAIEPPRYVDLAQLQGELEAAAISLPRGLTRIADELYTCDAQTAYIDLPPGSEPVIAAHVPATEPPPLPIPPPPLA